jgi:hypothetical protein
VQYCSARHDRLSAIGALTLSPRRQRINAFWRLYDDNIVATDVVQFLRWLHRALRQKLIVVLDRFNVHRKAVRLLLEQKARWLHVEWLPAYAPDLNPVEAMWSCTKYGDLANYTPDNLGDLGGQVVDALIRQYHDHRVRRSYFKTSKLRL